MSQIRFMFGGRYLQVGQTLHGSGIAREHAMYLRPSRREGMAGKAMQMTAMQVDCPARRLCCAACL